MKRLSFQNINDLIICRLQQPQNNAEIEVHQRQSKLVQKPEYQNNFLTHDITIT